MAKKVNSGIILPKKKAFKAKKSDRGEVNYKLISEHKSLELNGLLETYKKDKQLARVMFFNGSRNIYFIDRHCLFEYGNGDFQFTKFNKRFGISITSKVYTSEKNEVSIYYTKKRLWYKRGKVLKPLTLSLLTSFISEFEGKYGNDVYESIVYKYLSERFHWLKTLNECENINSISLNTIITKKLHKMYDIYKLIYGDLPKNIIKLMMDVNMYNVLSNHGNPQKLWKMMLRYIDKPENLNADILSDVNIFYDTCKMAITLDRKVNAKWNKKRLIQEHNDWSREISNILLKNEKERDLRIREVYLRFGESSGYRILSTNVDMLSEGILKRHCVGTYIDRVESGECCIYSVDGYTLQIKLGSIHNLPINNSNLIKNKISIDDYQSILYIAQFKGIHNCNAPKELIDEVNDKIINFMSDLSNKKYFTEEFKDTLSLVMDDLQF
jgi:PcfJ-like protein